MKTMNILFSFALAFMVACGGGNSQQPEQAQSQAQPADDVRTIELVGVDQMKFVVAEAQKGVYTSDTLTANGKKYAVVDSISAAPGEKLRIELTNVSSLPPSAMSHNFSLLELEVNPRKFANASSQAKDNNYIAPKMEDQVIAHTEMLGGGETDSVTFTVPDQTGRYDYLCTFPGHFAGGMRGKLIVEE